MTNKALAVLSSLSVLMLAGLASCGASSEEESGAASSAVTTHHVLVIGETLPSDDDVEAPAPSTSTTDAGLEETDDLDEEPTERAIGDGALLRSRRMFSDPGRCVLPIGAYDLAVAPSRSNDGLFWNVRFVKEPTGIGGVACGPSGWVDASAVSFRQIQTADPTPNTDPTEGRGASCAANPNFSADYIKPVRGPVTGRFGDCRDGCRRKHAGIDIAASTGTPVLAPEDGVVIDTGTRRGACGTVIQVRHPNGASTRFCHNSRLLVARGDCVTRGQKIAEVGNTGIGTGPHMHLEFYPSATGGAANPQRVFGY